MVKISIRANLRMPTVMCQAARAGVPGCSCYQPVSGWWPGAGLSGCSRIWKNWAWPTVTLHRREEP